MMKDQEDEKENEDMEVDDKDREERLERVKWKQKEYQTTSVCRSVLEEIILDSVGWRGRQVCKDLVEGVVMEDGWEVMEMKRLIAEIGMEEGKGRDQ